MEQIRIRQPKMPAAQSFIQIQRTFFAKLLNLIATHISDKEILLLISKTAKSIGIKGFSPRKANLIY